MSESLDYPGRMRTTTDTYTGRPFRWNMTVEVGGIDVPARCTARTLTYLHPDRVRPALLALLNRE